MLGRWMPVRTQLRNKGLGIQNWHQWAPRLFDKIRSEEQGWPNMCPSWAQLAAVCRAILDIMNHLGPICRQFCVLWAHLAWISKPSKQARESQEMYQAHLLAIQTESARNPHKQVRIYDYTLHVCLHITEIQHKQITLTKLCFSVSPRHE